MSVYINSSKSDDTYDDSVTIEKRNELEAFFEDLDNLLGHLPKTTASAEKEREQYERSTLGKFIMIIGERIGAIGSRQLCWQKDFTYLYLLLANNYLLDISDFVLAFRLLILFRIVVASYRQLLRILCDLRFVALLLWVGDGLLKLVFTPLIYLKGLIGLKVSR